MTETRRRLLYIHYHMPGRQATMTQISEAMGWSSFRTGNSHYGRLAKLVAQRVDFWTENLYLGTLCTLIEPKERGDHWLIILRPQVAEALERLGWV